MGSRMVVVDTLLVKVVKTVPMQTRSSTTTGVGNDPNTDMDWPITADSPDSCNTATSQHHQNDTSTSRQQTTFSHPYSTDLDQANTELYLEKETQTDWPRFQTRRTLHEIIEGRMRGKPTRGRRRIQMLHDLANDDGFVALKRAAEDLEGWRHRERMSKTWKLLMIWPWLLIILDTKSQPHQYT